MSEAPNPPALSSQPKASQTGQDATEVPACPLGKTDKIFRAGMSRAYQCRALTVFQCPNSVKVDEDYYCVALSRPRDMRE